ncbi:MAG: ABC transporter ATP-binding protein, partial [Clostridia bacterium]|nr:ABC transporter ATP-binding protein [Clostridia bacterium]
NFVNMLLRMCLRAPGMMIGALVMSIMIRPSLSAVFCVSIPILVLAIFIIIRMGFPRFTKMQQKIDELNSTVQENITNVRVVKSFVREDFEEQKFTAANSNLKNTGMSAYKMMIVLQPFMTICMNLTTVAVLWIGGQIVMNESGMVGGMQIGDLSSFVTYVTQILSSLMMVTMMFMMSSRAFASAKRIREVLDEKPDISNGNSYADKEIKRGEIEFRDVSFRYYKTSEETVLTHISLHIPAGSTVGIIGSTGCGKTTLVSMIPRLYDPDSGSILVDGTDVREYSLDNLRLGNPDAEYSDMCEAAKHAQADKFISSFSKGYDTFIEQGGTNVSGGQKQRLCIAAALLKKPKILILDDSTSAVDTATEAQIRNTFKNDLPEATKIIIAQRISSVIDADTIIVMNEGKITGMGTHKELFENNTEYREIYFSQVSESETNMERGENE